MKKEKNCNLASHMDTPFFFLLHARDNSKNVFLYHLPSSKFAIFLISVQTLLVVDLFKNQIYKMHYFCCLLLARSDNFITACSTVRRPVILSPERFKGFLGATHDFHERGSVLANGVKKRYCSTDWPTSVSFSSL